MSDTVISVENLSKRYLVGHETGRRERYTTLRDVIGREARSFMRKTVDFMRGREIVQGDQVEEFWALKDLTFEVKRGEVLGVVGRNGAGKSTLLKILSRITEPTTGRVTMRGRVASLLEVGTGFHPELTGRENIFLNGAILGMRRDEIQSKFDQIVAFAEVEKFLDTPVKRYSSGMYVRLAFAVAAHLEPDILVIDEVLAVGDAEFQNKCLGKMKELSGGGRTVLFVTHNIGAVKSLCSQAILLESGCLSASGEVASTIAAYKDGWTAGSVRPINKKSTKPTITSARIVHSDDKCVDASSVLLELVISSTVPLTKVAIDVRVKDDYLTPVGFGSVGSFGATRPVCLSTGSNRLLVKVSTATLAVGKYTLSFDLTHPFVEFFDRFEDCVQFDVPFRHLGGVCRDMEQRWGYGSVLIPVQLT